MNTNGKGKGPENSALRGLTRFLAELRDDKNRDELIEKYGDSPESIERFERQRSLPEGAFELILMLNDRELESTLDRICEKIKKDPDILNNLDHRFQAETQVMFAITKKYPRAMLFIETMQVEMEKAGLLQNLDPRLGPGQHFLVFANLGVAANAFLFVNGAVIVNAAIFTSVVFEVKVATDALAVTTQAVWTE